MNTPAHEEPTDTVKEHPSTPNLPLLGAVVAAFAPSRFRVRFRDREVAVRGFGILLRAGCLVEAFGGYTYGLSSERQCHLLDEQGIPYEIVG